ncbi:alcohol dehydrogenase catalytic domain-containing protein [Streptomyces sp. TRM70350]|uniref:alcohol dehydrogenase catalytic domain-containing protein n=1 Tax=Streptomyces sp. TRM70350 TaxID=2856165 RepID=UPI0027E12DF8|nr:alcohol dehydrogenase catalytic domain-containing protein [Streptomyces sp. TRM70350]
MAVGWFGGSCGHCTACRSCDVVHCPDRRVPGLSYPGGWATTITVPAAALARIPGELTAAEAAPFGCAGVTAFNALRYGGAEPGDRVAVVGIGGLGPVPWCVAREARTSALQPASASFPHLAGPPRRADPGHRPPRPSVGKSASLTVFPRCAGYSEEAGKRMQLPSRDPSLSVESGPRIHGGLPWLNRYARS